MTGERHLKLWLRLQSPSHCSSSEDPANTKVDGRLKLCDRFFFVSLQLGSDSGHQAHGILSNSQVGQTLAQQISSNTGMMHAVVLL